MGTHVGRTINVSLEEDGYVGSIMATRPVD